MWWSVILEEYLVRPLLNDNSIALNDLYSKIDDILKHKTYSSNVNITKTKVEKGILRIVAPLHVQKI